MKKLVLLFALFIVSNTFAQQMKIISAGDGAFISELKCLVSFKDGKLTLSDIMPVDMRDKEYRGIELQKGDEILFVNTARVKTLDEFNKAYHAIKTGEEVKLAVKRDSERFFVPFKKGDDSKMQRMQIKLDGNDMKSKDGKIMIKGKEVNIDSLKKSGAKIMIKKDDDKK